MLYARGIIYKAACMVLITITMVVSVSAASVTEVRAAEKRRGYRYSMQRTMICCTGIYCQER